MAIEDLDLEFEDEVESQKGDALDVEGDLTFSASPESVKEQMAQKKGAQAPRAQTAPTPRPTPKKAPTSNNVANINQAKPRAQVQAKPTNQVQPTHDYANDSVGDIAELRAEIETLKEQMQSVQHQASIKVAVAEAEKDYLVEFVSNAKVMDHQVTQILTRINKKVPALSSEVQTIKKYVNEFIKKSVPRKKGGE